MGRLPLGSTPAERRWKHACVSRTAATVDPVNRPDEALDAILGQNHRHEHDRLHTQALVRPRSAEHSYVANSIVSSGNLATMKAVRAAAPRRGCMTPIAAAHGSTPT
jgi:hypothetical protein